LRELAEYWRTEFDWRDIERRLNQLPNRRMTIDGSLIHFIHMTGRGPNPIPIVLTHGWPGSFLEFLDTLTGLTDPAADGDDPRDAFHVVVPSLPGFGFSGRPVRPGMNVFRIADLWAKLMASLGHTRFGAQGGDFGAGVATALALEHPDRIIGIHLNYIPGSYRPWLQSHDALDAEERRFLLDVSQWDDEYGAYAHVQRTTPQTASLGLNDSPAALAGWLIEKYRAWSDCEGDVERRFAREDLLAQVTLYWVTQTIASANRLYYEAARRPLHFAPDKRVEVPCGVARFPKEAPFPPRQWVERGYRIERWTAMARGGHFAAWEEPRAFVDDVRAFFRPMR
jgi:pimeloyl-ACP methyl ester carboxylesterase